MAKRWTLRERRTQQVDEATGFAYIEQGPARYTARQMQDKRLELACEMLALVVEAGLMTGRLHAEVCGLFERLAQVRKQVRHS